MNARYLTRDGHPWLPVMGEFHFSRVPESQWEDEILKMKAAGVDVIATYVFWIHHEEIEGQFDWSGQRDLRRFAQLCGLHGMLLFPRIGPWAHGETRNGGFPDWLLKKTAKPRSNDAVYLSAVNSYFQQIGKQLRGLMWKDGGPVIGIQLENEYSDNGPGRGEEHILRLKKLAIEAGMDVPFYTETGWDNATIPKGEVVTVFGGYPDAPWDSSLKSMPPSEVYAFRFGSRVSGNIKAIGGPYDFPFMTAEMGGGVQDTYHRRPVIASNDVAAMMPVMLGSGVNLYGTYMFQGGENPDGKLSTLQESQDTGYPTDVPVKSYDFQAPLSEFGEERATFRKLKVIDYFLNDFGDQLAPMPVYAPSRVPASPEDLSVPRVAVRSNGRSGFVFFNNYVRDAEMIERKNFQVRVKEREGEVMIPAEPITLPAGAYGIWPFGLEMGRVRLHHATAQLFCRLAHGKQIDWYFIAEPGVPAEFAFEDAPGIRIDSRGSVLKDGGLWRVSNVKPSRDAAIVVKDEIGAETRIVLLKQEDAENAWRLGDGRLLISRSQFFADGSRATLLSDGDPRFDFDVEPPLSQGPHAGFAIHRSMAAEPDRDFSVLVSESDAHAEWKQTDKAQQVRSVKLGPALSWRPSGVATSPQDADFDRSAKWSITIPATSWKQADDLFLEIAYEGDVARLTSGGRLLTDNFYNGEKWRVGLKRFRKQIAAHGLELEVLPLRGDAPVFVEPRFRAKISREGQVVTVKSIKLVPQYRLDLDFSGAK